MIFDKKQVQKLAKYETSFRTAVLSNYVSCLPSASYEEIKRIYEQAVGHSYNLKASCAKCVLDFIKIVGRRYFESLEYISKEADTASAPKKKTTKKKTS